MFQVYRMIPSQVALINELNSSYEKYKDIIQSCFAFDELGGADVVC